MDIALKVVEKLLFSILSSLVLFIAGFSLMTGKFPPNMNDLKRVIDISKQMYFSNEEYNVLARNYETFEPSMEQMAQLQRLSLKRTEAALALSKIMVRFPKGVPSEQLAEKLEKIAFQIDSAGVDLQAVQIEIQQAMAAKANSSQANTQ